MDRLTVLVIEQGAEAALVCAALALRPELCVVEAADLQAALARLERDRTPARLAIAGSAALEASPQELVARLGAHGIPVIGVAAGLPPEARRDALAAGVREIHVMPTD